MEKINLVELLKDCPKGMELDCTMFDNVSFEGLDTDSYPIKIKVKGDDRCTYLTENGCWDKSDNAKCVVFPKGRTTWEGFVPPCKFKDGDIVYIKTDSHNYIEFIIIFKEIRNNHIHKHACFAYQYFSINKGAVCHIADVEIMRLATEEEKQKLFDAIKANGYKWDAETKTFEKLIEPKFKVGDRIKSVLSSSYYTVVDIKNNNYFIKSDSEKYPYQVSFENEINYELVPNKFDITTLKPFESRVLVRDKNTEKWKSNFWGFYDNDSAMNYPYECVGGAFAQCIPYEGNEHLLGKTDDCKEYFKTWK